MTDKVTYKWMEDYEVVFGEDVEEKGKQRVWCVT